MLLKKNSHAVAIRCTGDIVLEFRILNAISHGGRKDLFYLGNNLVLFKSLNKSQLTSFVKCHITEINFVWKNVNILPVCTFTRETLK